MKFSNRQKWIIFPYPDNIKLQNNKSYLQYHQKYQCLEWHLVKDSYTENYETFRREIKTEISE